MRFRILALVAIAAGLMGQTPQRPNALRQMSRQFEELVSRVDPAVVQIITSGFGSQEQEDAPFVKVSRSSGSGVVVDPSGYILTNAHVIRNARSVQVLLPEPAEEAAQYRSVIKPSGKRVAARVVGQDRQTDIAVLKIEAQNLPHLAFEDSETLRQGQLVLAFGSPFGLENSVTMGVISSVARQIRPDDPMIYLQTDAAINPGNSGGPLVDPEGKLVGINTFILTTSGVNAGVGFAVPSNIAKSVFEHIKAHGYVKRGQIGVIAQTITPELAKALGLSKEWGVIIADVSPQSAAEAAGLEAKDIVLTFNGKVMENARQMGVNIYASSGKTATVEILRGSEKMTKRIAVLERPQDPDRILSLVEGEVNHVPRLGILAVDLTEKVTALLPPLRRLNGAVVAGVVADLAVEDQFLAPGDVIFGVNSTKVSNLAELKAAVQALKAGQPVALHVERMGQFQFVTAELN